MDFVEFISPVVGCHGVVLEQDVSERVIEFVVTHEVIEELVASACL